MITAPYVACILPLGEALGPCVAFTIRTSRLRGMLDLEVILTIYVIELGRLVD